MIRSVAVPVALSLVVVAAAPARAEDANARKILNAADAILAPDIYEAEVEMVAYRPDGSKREYGYRVYKSGYDKLLLTFDKPRTLDGHSALRRDDALWRYIPSLKRAMRISSRSDFEGGDFRNADVLRVNLARDYAVTGMKPDKDLLVLDLKAKTPEAAYERIKLWVRKKDNMPIRQELYAASGKLLRSLQTKDPKDLGSGHVAPSVFEMTNEVAKGRKTIMTVKKLVKKDSIPESRFRKQTMGR